MSSGWYSRNSAWVNRALRRCWLAGICTVFFVCFSVLDTQMRFFEENSTLSTDLSSKIPPKSSQILPVSSRKLSSHTENALFKGQFNYIDYDGDEVLSRILKDTQKSALEQPSNYSLKRRLPQVIIIGVKKGGTRALLEILRLHPEVRAPGPEPHFFDRHYHKGLQWYRRQMPLSMDSQITMEKTPSYLVTPEVPHRVHNMSKHIRLLVVVRDPVTRAVSDYTQASSKRLGDSRTFEEMAFLNASTGLVDTSWSAIKIGVYAKHLEKWLAYFPLERFHFVSGERLISDPVQELQSVQKFLGLRPFISANHFFFNQTKGFPCLRRTPQSTVPHCLGKTKGRSHPYIPSSALQRLRDFYRPFNQKFYRMVKRDFGWL